MRDLSSLFADDAARDTPTSSSANAEEGVRALFAGTERTLLPEVRRIHRADAARLQAVVDDAARSGGAVSDNPPPHAPTARRMRRPVDWLTAGAAAVAGVAIIVASTVTIVHAAEANPAGDALSSLVSDEASLLDQQEALSAAQQTAAASLEDAQDRIQRLDQALTALSGASDEQLRAAAVAALADYRAKVAAVAIPDPVPLYERGTIDDRSVREIATAIDGVQTVREATNRRAGEIDDAQKTLTALRQALQPPIAALGSSLSTTAAQLVADHPLAARSFRDAVTAAAAAVPGAQADGRTGTSAMIAYTTAVAALRDADARAAAEETPSRSTGGSGSSDTSSPSTPAAEPTPPPAEPTTEPQPEPTQSDPQLPLP